MTAAVNAEQQPSSAAAGGHGNDTSDNAEYDYITMDDLLQDMADNDDGDRDGSEPAGVMEAEDVELFEELANRLDHDDILFRSPRWVENFREINR
jgi:hypothetical protein